MILQVVQGAFLVEVLLEKYENPEHKFQNGDCCDPKESACNTGCLNNIWLCVSRKNTAKSCDLVNERINENTVSDKEDFDENESRFKNPFTISLPEKFTEVCFVNKKSKTKESDMM